MDYIFTPKNANKYYCKICDFQCSKQSDWNRHILTRKHNKSYTGVTNDDNITQKSLVPTYEERNTGNKKWFAFDICSIFHFYFFSQT